MHTGLVMFASGRSSRKRRLIAVCAVYTLNALFVSSTALIVAGAVWEYSTREYLHGFVDAVVPHDASSAQKVEAILKWMGRGPERSAGQPTGDELGLDPLDTLNFQSLIQVCGGAVNAFVNLGNASGLESRRLLLLDASLKTTHVVAEVRLDGRWVIVDPVFRIVLRDDSGRMLTRNELSNPLVLRQATKGLNKYDPQYSYAISTHTRYSALPFISQSLQERLDSVTSQWESILSWSLLFERRSYAAMISGCMLFLICLLARPVVYRWGLTLIPASRVYLLRCLKREGRILLKSTVES
jgi:hypothetical protein